MVPGIDRGAHRGAIGTVESHQDIRVVVAGRGKAPARVSEHLSEPGPRTHGRDARCVVDHAVFGEELYDFVVQAVINAVRVLMDEVGDLILVDELPNRSGFITDHQCPPQISARRVYSAQKMPAPTERRAGTFSSVRSCSV